jgi:hypothetical protein
MTNKGRWDENTIREKGTTLGLTKPGHCGHNRPGKTCGICYPVEPVITRNSDSPTHESVESHPAYAVIGITRWQGSGHRLFGSDFTHRVGLTLTIKRAEKYRSLSNDWYHGREELIEVNMSEAQWATLVSAVGQGEGVPCTIEHLGRERVSIIPEPKETRVKQFGDEMKRRFDGIRETIANLRQRITEGKGGKESLRMLDSIEQAAVSNTTFTAEQFDRHMEKTVEKAKAEIHGHAIRVGLAPGKSPLVLDENRKAIGWGE